MGKLPLAETPGTKLELERRGEKTEKRKEHQESGEKGGDGDGQKRPRSKPRTMDCEDPGGDRGNDTISTGTGRRTRPAKKKDSKEMMKVKKRVFCLIILAFVCIAFGSTLIFIWPSMFDNVMKKELILSPNSTSFKMWNETPVPMYLKIYLFNWTNAATFERTSSQKPHFEEMGPYVYREIDYKVNLKWNDNGTITFQQRRQWHFVPSMSKGSLMDEVTILNPVIASIGYFLRNKSQLEKDIAYLMVKKIFSEKMSITLPVKTILFDGYEDPLLKLLGKIGMKKIPFDKFAFFYQRNNSETYDGTFNMQTGENNFNELGLIKAWKFQRTSPFYPGNCGNLESTLGDLWPPLLENQTVSVFSPDICTTLTLKNSGKSDWLGITGIKFVSDADTLDNGTKVPSRKCYCQGVECMPSGVLNVSACKFDAPAFISSPHFYLADETYRNNISGMNPKKEDHEFSLIVQPKTGTPMQVRAALQLNFLVRPNEFRFFKNLPPMLVPMMWFTQEVNLTSEYSNQIKILLLAPTVGTALFSVIAGIGVLLIIMSAFMYNRQKKRDELNESLIPKDIPNMNSESGTENEE